jgi:hypothetical protein
MAGHKSVDAKYAKNGKKGAKKYRVGKKHNLFARDSWLEEARFRMSE